MNLDLLQKEIKVPVLSVFYAKSSRQASVKLFELGVRTPGGLFWPYGTPGVSILGVFRTPSLPIFGVIFGLLEATKMYKLF